MAQKRSPDGRLVYLHCSSIFSGANAQVRKAKKISQLLQKHKVSIKILTKEFTLADIAAVAKELLDAKIFESLPRAKLRYPELFQPSETHGAERAASEAEVIRIEAEAVQDIVLTSDDDEEDKCLDIKHGKRQTELDGLSEAKAEAVDQIQVNPVAERPQSKCQAELALAVPRLHPVYLPFRTQHNILVLVQSLLEECCLEFGNTWVPDLMGARKWEEAESIELTQWTKRFLKHAKSLPPSAIEPIPGKSIAEVLFGTSILRHSAVHRLPTSATGILSMLSAAITFAEALKDNERAEKVLAIRTQLKASVEEIVQHQNLLERKLTAQLEDIARRRAELDELERTSIEEMLATDKQQRTEAGSAFERFLVGSQQISHPCACNHAPSLDGLEVDRKVEENIENDLIDEGEDCEQTPPSEEKPGQDDRLQEYGRPHCQDIYDASLEGEPEMPAFDFPTLKSRRQNQTGKKTATYSWDIPALEEAPFVVDEAPASETASPFPVHAKNTGWGWPRHGAWGLVATSTVAAEPLSAREEPIATDEPCITALAEASPREEPYVSAPEEKSLPEDDSPAEEAIPDQELVATEKAASEASLETPQAEPIVESFNSAEEDVLPNYDNIRHQSEDPCEPTPEPDVAPMYSVTAEAIECDVPHPSAAVSARRDSGDFHSHPPSVPSSTKTSVLDAAAPEVPTKDSHLIALKILNGSKVFRAIVVIKECTRTAILNQARVYCTGCAEDNQSLGKLLPKRWDLALLSLKIYGSDTDLSTYEVEDLFPLVKVVEKTGIPTFTLQIFEV